MNLVSPVLRVLPPGAHSIETDPSGADPARAGRHVFLRHPPLPQLQGWCYGRRDDDPPPGAHTQAAHALHTSYPQLLRLPVLCSPARRCRGLAEALCAHTGNSLTTRSDPRLWEMDFGAWEGQRWDALPRSLLDQWAADVAGFHPPGGECFRDVVARVRDCLRTLETPHLIVTHAGVVRAAVHVLAGLSLTDAAAVEVPYLRPMVVVAPDPIPV